MELLDDDRLGRSAVVANNAMNRVRGLTGVNSYARELGFEPLAALDQRLDQVGEAAWLDLCCGNGRALIEAARARPAGLRLVGIDLVDYFEAHDDGVTLIPAPILQWSPREPFDVITCVHGLHYVGDKLGALARALRWLCSNGRFCGHLDLQNLKRLDGTSIASTVRAWLRHADIHYDAGRRLISCTGPRELAIVHRYLGADDRAGPNFTGQPAVDSYYDL